jgi:hypothetical protein
MSHKHHLNGAVSSPQSESLSSIGGSWNPLPLPFVASADMDLSTRFVELLRKAMSSVSSNCSSVTNPSYINPNIVFKNNDLTNMSHKHHLNGAELTSLSNSANYSNMSMTTADLCAAMGGRVDLSSMAFISLIHPMPPRQVHRQSVHYLVNIIGRNLRSYLRQKGEKMVNLRCMPG